MPTVFDASAALEQDATVFIAFELSKAQWKLGVVVPEATKLSRCTVVGGDTAAVAARLAAACAKTARGGRPLARVVSLYEAEYDGFWLHRWLTAPGVVTMWSTRHAFR